MIFVNNTTGTIKFFPDESDVFGYLKCDGSIISTTQYASLYSVAGNIFVYP